MSSKVTFRPALTSDVGTIVELMQIFYAEDSYPFSKNQATVLVERFLASGEFGRLWVADSEQAVVGYFALTLGFSFEYGGKVAVLDELYVREDFRGQGLGREAIALCEAYCLNQGISALHLEVEAYRTVAAALYEKSGFKGSGRRPLTKRFPA